MYIQNWCRKGGWVLQLVTERYFAYFERRSQNVEVYRAHVLNTVFVSFFRKRALLVDSSHRHSQGDDV